MPCLRNLRLCVHAAARVAGGRRPQRVL